MLVTKIFNRNPLISRLTDRTDTYLMLIKNDLFKRNKTDNKEKMKENASSHRHM